MSPLYRPMPAIPLEKPLAGTFLGSTRRMPVSFEEWRSGVAVPSYEDITIGAWPGDDCAATYEDQWSDIDDGFDLADKEQTTGECTTYQFDPTILYHLIEGNVTPGNEDEIRALADNWQDVQVSAGLARAFYRGSSADGLVVDGTARNPIPRTIAHDLTADMDTPAAVHPELALSQLLAAWAACSFAGGAFLHIPPLALPWLIAHGAVAQVGGKFLGPGGVTVISDPGMPSNRQLISDGSDSSSDPFSTNSIGSTYDIAEHNECWMFVTGPVFADIGPVRSLDPRERTFDVRRNRWVYLVEQPAIFMYDPMCSFAVATFIPSPSAGDI